MKILCFQRALTAGERATNGILCPLPVISRLHYLAPDGFRLKLWSRSRAILPMPEATEGLVGCGSLLTLELNEDIGERPWLLSWELENTGASPGTGYIYLEVRERSRSEVDLLQAMLEVLQTLLPPVELSRTLLEGATERR